MTRDLWNGADVRWVGPRRTRGGAELSPGDRAVVVDAGRHHVRSFSTLYHVAGTRPARPAWKVTIRNADGADVRVRRNHLEVVAPDHPLLPEPDASAADWWLERLAGWGRQAPRVSAFVPEVFAAVARVRHPSEGELDGPTARALIDVLGEATRTPDDVFVAVWEGWGDTPPQRFPGAAHLSTPARGHFLLRGPLAGVLTSVAATRSERLGAGLWWPNDRSWFVATEIDLAWTFVAGDEQLVGRILTDPRLGAARTSFDAPATDGAGHA